MTESTPPGQAGPLGTWRATYTPGSWVVLSGPTSMVVLSPAPGPMSTLLNAMWDDVVAARSIDDLVGTLAAFNVEALPSFAAFFWGRGGLRTLVRGAIRVMDVTTGDYVADGVGIQTWSEVGLGDLRQVRIDMTEVPQDALHLPLVVGAVTASAIVLDATDGVRVSSPQSSGPAAAPLTGPAGTDDDESAAPQPEPAAGPQQRQQHPGSYPPAQPPPDSPPSDQPSNQPAGPPAPQLPTTESWQQAGLQPPWSPALPPPGQPGQQPGQPQPGYGPPQSMPSDPRPPASTPAGPVTQPEDDAGQDGEPVFATSSARAHQATDPGTAGGAGLVLADLCVAQHPNPPGAGRCRTCGSPVPPQGSRLVTRPVLAVLRPSSGASVEVDRPVLIGRSPSADRVPGDQLPRLLTVPSPSHDISRTHVRVTPEGWVLTATDEYSTNGTILVRPGAEPERERLAPGEPVSLQPGNVLDLGDGMTITVELPS